MTKKRAKILLNKFLKNNDVCSLYIGMPGAGKSTYCAYLAKLCYLAGYKCFCNLPVKYTIPYTKEDLGKYDMTGSLILLDEAGLVYSNRSWTTAFTNESLLFLKYLRHYKCSIALFSQSNDVDVCWIRMSKSVFLIHKSVIPGFTSMEHIERRLDVNPDTHKIEDFYDKDTGLFKRIFRFRFRRKPYYHMFDSWSAPKLPPMKSYDTYLFLNEEPKSFWCKLSDWIRNIPLRLKKRSR